MTTTAYRLEAFVEDATQIMHTGGDRASIAAELTPLLARLMRNPDLLEERFRRTGANGLYRFQMFEAADGSLTISAPAFLTCRPTPIHDHLTWGVIGVYAGRQLTTRYRRYQDSADGTTTHLEPVEHGILGPGAIYPLLPPDDIHRIETVSDEPGISIHVLGADLRRQRRHVFEPALYALRDIEGESMLR